MPKRITWPWRKFERVPFPRRIPLGPGQLTKTKTCKFLLLTWDRFERPQIFLPYIWTSQPYSDTIIETTLGTNPKTFQIHGWVWAWVLDAWVSMRPAHDELLRTLISQNTGLKATSSAIYNINRLLLLSVRRSCIDSQTTRLCSVRCAS